MNLALNCHRIDGNAAVAMGAIERLSGAGDKSRVVSFVFSTAAKDRYGDVVVQNFNLKNFKANPVILLNHNKSIIIGRCVKIGIVDGKLQGDIEFAETDEAEKIFQLVKGGFLNATSIGFQPANSEAMTDKDGRFLGYKFNGPNELLEISVVSIPANAQALVTARGMGLDVSPVVNHTNVIKSLPFDHKVMDEAVGALDQGNITPARIVDHQGKSYAYTADGAYLGQIKSGKLEMTKQATDALAQRNLEAIERQSAAKAEEPEAEPQAIEPDHDKHKAFTDMAIKRAAALRAQLASL